MIILGMDAQPFDIARGCCQSSTKLPHEFKTKSQNKTPNGFEVSLVFGVGPHL